MKFLAPLTRSGALGMWHDRLLEPGQNWAKEIDDNIEGAALMVLLVSADFLESEYCIGIELHKALERHRSEANAMRVVPILVRPCPWQMEPALEELQVLPSGAKPVTKWNPRDDAWTDVVEELYPIIQLLAV